MHRLNFYGYSDDTFGEYGVTGDDVDNCGSCEPIQCVIDCGEQGRLMAEEIVRSEIVHKMR